MKKSLSVVFVALVAMAVFASTAFAAPAQDNKSVTLIGVDYQMGGIVLLFQTSGLSKGDLKNASFFAHSNNYDIFCQFKDDTTVVRCVVSKKLSAYAGEGFQVTLAGFRFWGVLPEAQDCFSGDIMWYPIEGYYQGEYLGAQNIPAWVWELFEDEGILEYYASEGFVINITGDAFCAPGYEEIPV